MTAILIRDIAKEDVVKLERLAKEKSISREEYLRRVIRAHSSASSIKEVENKYENFLHLITDAIENNSERLEELTTDMKHVHNSIERQLKISLAIQRDSEEMLKRLLDAINTVLIENNLEICFPASYMESPVLTKSREYEKNNLAHLKQQKDSKLKKHKDILE